MKSPRSITVSADDYGNYGHKISTITVYPPEEAAATCLIELQTHEAELAPYPQGFFAGFTFQKKIDSPVEEYDWTDDQLKEKYGPMFNR